MLESELPDLRLDVARQLRLPSVSVGQQLLLAVEELLVVDGRVLVVRALNDGIDWACVLAVPAVDALGHIDVVTRGPPGSVGAWLALDGDCVGRASSSAEFAGNASALYDNNRSSPVG